MLPMTNPRVNIHLNDDHVFVLGNWQQSCWWYVFMALYDEFSLVPSLGEDSIDKFGKLYHF